jgi:hypothetical protein
MWPETEIEAEAEVEAKADLGFVEIGKPFSFWLGLGYWRPWVKSTTISLTSDAVEMLEFLKSGIDGTLLLVQISAILPI